MTTGQTPNQLLVEKDASTTAGVILMAATNLPRGAGPALQRPAL
jgi:ATP-dependent Zn protease